MEKHLPSAHHMRQKLIEKLCLITVLSYISAIFADRSYPLMLTSSNNQIQVLPHLSRICSIVCQLPKVISSCFADGCSDSIPLKPYTSPNLLAPLSLREMIAPGSH